MLLVWRCRLSTLPVRSRCGNELLVGQSGAVILCYLCPLASPRHQRQHASHAVFPKTVTLGGSATLKSWKTDFLNGPNDSKSCDRESPRRIGVSSRWPPGPSPHLMHTPATSRLWLPYNSHPKPMARRSSSGSIYSARPKDMPRRLASDKQATRADSLRNLTSALHSYRKMCFASSVVKHDLLVRADRNAGDRWRYSK